MEQRVHSEGRVGIVAGEFVLYWVQVTLRARDNPGFNFAVEQANRLNQPVLVYHGLRSDDPWANDRFHTYILESAADLAREFSEMGLQYEFFLERDPGGRKGESALIQLAGRASLVVTDFFPSFTIPRQTARLHALLREPAPAGSQRTTPPRSGRRFRHRCTGCIARPAVQHSPRYPSRAAGSPAPYLHPVGAVLPRVTRRIEVPFLAPDFSDIASLVRREGLPRESHRAAGSGCYRFNTDNSKN